MNVYHVYYVAQATGQIVAYYRAGPNGTWSANTDTSWGKSDGGLAAVSWGDQVRLLYFTGGRLTISALSNLTWSKPEYL
jgi:hypothetical protein